MMSDTKENKISYPNGLEKQEMVILWKKYDIIKMLKDFAKGKIYPWLKKNQHR